MAKVTLVFKGGAVVDVDIESVTVTRNQRDGITKIAWTDGNDHPLTIEPSELAAVIERKK